MTYTVLEPDSGLHFAIIGLDGKFIIVPDFFDGVDRHGDGVWNEEDNWEIDK